jgi:hypothetical protein
VRSASVAVLTQLLPQRLKLGVAVLGVRVVHALPVAPVNPVDDCCNVLVHGHPQWRLCRIVAWLLADGPEMR